MDKNEINVNLIEVLEQMIVSFNTKIEKSVENNEISKSVKQLLSCLQSVSKRHSFNENPFLSSIGNKKPFNEELTKCLTKLEEIVLYENSFAETSVLSGLAIAFFVNICFCDDINKAIHLFFKLMVKQSIVCIDFSHYKVDNNLSEVLAVCQSNTDLSKVSLLSALLNCSYFCHYLIEFQSKIFIEIHCHIINICSKRLVHQFHVFRVLQHWFKAFKTHLNELAAKEPNLFDDKTLISRTLEEMDTNWEHPINGVKDCIKSIYNLLLETFTTFKKINSNNNCLKNYDLIAEEVIKTCRLSLTSKAKYRKLSALIQFIGYKPVLQFDPNLCQQMLKYLSINSLSTAIIELYKSVIISMKSDTNVDLLDIWSHYWLPYVCDALKSKNKVIHNNTVAHLLPNTVINIDGSTQLIFENIEDSLIAQISLVRTAIDQNIVIDFLPSFSWFKQILVNNEDIVREEGLSLLIDERYIKDRLKVFELFRLFLLLNLNVDNPSFRQRMVSKVEHFITKVCISLSDKMSLYGVYDEMGLKSIEFLNQYLNIITSHMVSGASYQRRNTCLLLFDSFMTIIDKNGLNFINHLQINSIYFLLLLSVVDKDDKVRKMASNSLSVFHKKFDNKIDYSLETIAEIGIYFLNSPRHQESHSGGLLMKYIINCFDSMNINANQMSNELQIIEYFVSCAENQFQLSQKDFLIASKSTPIHGFILALNNCLSFDRLKKFSSENQLKVVINDSILLCFHCIDFMLRQLSNTNTKSSPSFQEMCESLETIISEQIITSDGNCLDDISTSNDFQLLLSMCWLNIKECSFLLSNCIEFCLPFETQLISDSIVQRIGEQLIKILSKCRHKGVIDATCIALTQYTVSLIKMKSRNSEHIQTLKTLLTDSLNCMTKSALTSSITRRAAGVALTIQAILIGESEAYSQGFKLDISLFSLTIDILISIAKSEIPETVDTINDLPQTYALHILRAIVSTASLSRFTIKTVEFLLPICVKHFSSEIWQIRNASLQVFGASVCRMLGQRKTSDVDVLMIEGSTITSIEFFSRYPTLMSEFKHQFEESIRKSEKGFMSSELIPILSLFASFSPICFGDNYEDKQILSYLVHLLSNRIWKIRMLSAKALSCLLPIPQLQPLLLELIERKNLNCNSIHGLMLCAKHLLELKEQMKDNDYEIIKSRFLVVFEMIINDNKKCYILSDLYKELFFNYSNVCLEINSCGQALNETQNYSQYEDMNEVLSEIQSNIEFNKSEDIRLLGTKQLDYILNNCTLLNCIHLDVFKVVDILLVILQDEDRTVRTEAEIIASKLCGCTPSAVLSFNVAIDNIIMGLTQNPNIVSQELTDYLMNKLETILPLNELFESQQQNEILFEREEKNVFAEPLFLFFRLSECLRRIILEKKTDINDKNIKQLVSDCRDCLKHKPTLETKRLIRFSVWKLPKLFVGFTSLFLRIDLMFNCFNHSIVDSLNQLQLKDNTTVEPKSDLMLTEEEILVLKQTYSLLSTKFPFLSHLRDNTLSGYSLLRYDFEMK